MHTRVWQPRSTVRRHEAAADLAAVSQPEVSASCLYVCMRISIYVCMYVCSSRVKHHRQSRMGHGDTWMRTAVAGRNFSWRVWMKPMCYFCMYTELELRFSPPGSQSIYAKCAHVFSKILTWRSQTSPRTTRPSTSTSTSVPSIPREGPAAPCETPGESRGSSSSGSFIFGGGSSSAAVSAAAAVAAAAPTPVRRGQKRRRTAVGMSSPGMCVCVCACLYVNIYMFIYICLYIYIYIYIYIYTHTHTWRLAIGFLDPVVFPASCMHSTDLNPMGHQMHVKCVCSMIFFSHHPFVFFWYLPRLILSLIFPKKRWSAVVEATCGRVCPGKVLTLVHACTFLLTWILFESICTCALETQY
jgi:hypothetical protein